MEAEKCPLTQELMKSQRKARENNVLKIHLEIPVSPRKHGGSQFDVELWSLFPVQCH